MPYSYTAVYYTFMPVFLHSLIKNCNKAFPLGYNNIMRSRMRQLVTPFISYICANIYIHMMAVIGNLRSIYNHTLIFLKDIII